MSRTSTAEAAAAASEEQDGVPGELERAGQNGPRRRAVLEQRRLPVAGLVFLVPTLLPLPLPLRALHVAEVELQLLQVAVLERVPDPERRPQVHLLRPARDGARSGSVRSRDRGGETRRRRGEVDGEEKRALLGSSRVRGVDLGIWGSFGLLEPWRNPGRDNSNDESAGPQPRFRWAGTVGVAGLSN